MDVAALDLGSNSFHLLVARASSDGLSKLGSKKEVVRLGLSGGTIPAPLFERALEAVDEMVAFARTFTGARVVAVGTSALREASNGLEFVREASLRSRVFVEILSGADEARLVCRGARSALRELPERVGVIDIGGGSVELAIADGNRCHAIASLPLGFLRFTHGIGTALTFEAPSGEWIRDEAMPAVERALAFAPEAWVFSGGTARAFRSLADRLGVCDGRKLTANAVSVVARQVTEATPKRLIALGVSPARAETLGAGAVVLASLVNALNARSILVSPAGLREGVVLREVRRLALESRGAAIGRTTPPAANLH